MMSRTLIAAWCVVVAAGFSLFAQGQKPPEPPGQVRFVSDEVLIQFQPGMTEATKANARATVNGRRKEGIRREIGPEGSSEVVVVGNGMPVDVAVRLLLRHPGVAVAEPNVLYTHQVTSNDPQFLSGALWGMYGQAGTPTNIYGSQANAAWNVGATGSSGVIVAVLDEGLDYTHPDLVGNVWTNPFDLPDGIDNDHNGFVDDLHGWDFLNNDSSVYDCLSTTEVTPAGGNGGGPSCGSLDAHGTHVAGTIGATGGNGVGVVGVNWSVQIISLKFLGATGGSTATAVRAIDYLIDLKTRHGLNIVAVNNSWGGGGYTYHIHNAILRAAKAGILFTAAAGNNGVNIEPTDVSFYPAEYSSLVGTATTTAANYESVIAVASLNSSGAKSGFSNYGATAVDIAAPGEGIVSTTPNSGYSNFSGTSMATPHVTGALALYAALHPGVTAAALRAALMAAATSTPTPSMAGRCLTNGRLNIARWVVEGPSEPEPPTDPIPDPPCGVKGCPDTAPPPPCGKTC